MTELTPAEGVPPLGHVVAALSGDGADVASLTRVLTGVLADALPPGMVEVEYERGVADRLKGRLGTPVGLTVTVGDRVLSMRHGRTGRPEPVVAHSVRGVVITRSPVGVTEWVTTLAQEMTKLAAEDDTARIALERLLLR